MWIRQAHKIELVVRRLLQLNGRDAIADGQFVRLDADRILPTQTISPWSSCDGCP